MIMSATVWKQEQKNSPQRQSDHVFNYTYVFINVVQILLVPLKLIKFILNAKCFESSIF